MIRSDEIEIGESCAVVILAVVQALRARTAGLRKIYLEFLVCFAPLATGVWITGYKELRSPKEILPGTWLDLWWTEPFLVTAFWATQMGSNLKIYS